jgi:hypothetical protein
MHRTCSRLAALSLAFLLGSTGLFGAPKPSSPGLPKGVHPLPPELAGRMDEVVKKAEEYRGLRLKRPVPFGTLTEPGFSPRLSAQAEAELASAEMRALDVSLKAFGLLPQESSAAKIYHDLLSEQVAAYYDPDRKYLAMVEHQDKPVAEEMVQAFGPEGAKRLQEGILAHEVTHAIDDQSFGIGRKKDLLSDTSAAFAGLVEGDATLVMFDYMFAQRLEGMPGFAGIMREIFKDPGKLFALSDLPGAASLAKAPAWFSDSLMFSYFQGLAFCLSVKQTGGQKLLDYAFLKDPPRSTEQILHPEKWYAKRDDPVAIAWPSLDGVLPGWKKAAEGQMGEEGTLILLRERGKDEKGAEVAAAGWGGDRFAVYEKDGKSLLLWITEWDSEKDAAELAAAVPRLGEEWRAVRGGAPTRVVVVHGPLAGEPGTAVEAALQAAPAERPAGHDLDLAALGAVPEKTITPNLAGAIHNLPSGEVSADGRTFTDRDTGFSVRLPAGKAGWTMVSEPEEKLSVQLKSEDRTARVNVGAFGMSSPAPLEEVADQIRASLKAKLGEKGRDLGSEILTRGETRYLEMHTEVEAEDGQRIHNWTRVFTHGANMISVVAVAPAARWAAEEPVLREILEGFTLLPPPAPLGADDHTYTDTGRGFSLRVPGEGWQLTRQAGAMQLLTMTGPEGTPQVQVLGYRSDFVGGLDLMGQSVAVGMKESMRAAGQEFTMQISGVVEQDGKRWYETQFARPGQEARRGITRIYLRGKQLFVLTGFAPAASWAEQEKTLLSILDSFTLAPAPAH